MRTMRMMEILMGEWWGLGLSREVIDWWDFRSKKLIVRIMKVLLGKVTHNKQKA